MTLEYTLLLALFVFFILGAMTKGPHEAFQRGGPLLGARVEKHLATGVLFQERAVQPIPWRERK